MWMIYTANWIHSPGSHRRSKREPHSLGTYQPDDPGRWYGSTQHLDIRTKVYSCSNDSNIILIIPHYVAFLKFSAVFNTDSIRRMIRCLRILFVNEEILCYDLEKKMLQSFEDYYNLMIKPMITNHHVISMFKVVMISNKKKANTSASSNYIQA